MASEVFQARESGVNPVNAISGTGRAAFTMSAQNNRNIARALYERTKRNPYRLSQVTLPREFEDAQRPVRNRQRR